MRLSFCSSRSGECTEGGGRGEGGSGWKWVGGMREKRERREKSFSDEAMTCVLRCSLLLQSGHFFYFFFLLLVTLSPFSHSSVSLSPSFSLSFLLSPSFSFSSPFSLPPLLQTGQIRRISSLLSPIHYPIPPSTCPLPFFHLL